MKVSNFMIPADKVITALPQDTVQTVMGIMMEKRIGTVVVVDKVEDKETKVEEENLKPTTWLPMPVGIITKSDIMKGYQNQISINAPCSEIMHPCADKELKTCTPNMGNHEVAQILREIKTHHLIVVDQDGGHGRSGTGHHGLHAHIRHRPGNMCLKPCFHGC